MVSVPGLVFSVSVENPTLVDGKDGLLKFGVAKAVRTDCEDNAEFAVFTVSGDLADKLKVDSLVVVKLETGSAVLAVIGVFFWIVGSFVFVKLSVGPDTPESGVVTSVLVAVTKPLVANVGSD